MLCRAWARATITTRSSAPDKGLWVTLTLHSGG